MLIPALFVVAAAMGQSPQQQPVDAPPHDITQVDAAPLGGAIAVPLPLNRKRQMKKYDLPELAGAHQALGSQLIDGKLPKPLIDYITIAPPAVERLSIFEGGLVVIDVSGSGATIRKKVVIPPDALASYRKATSADVLRRIPETSLAPPVSGRRATVRVYDDTGGVLERDYDPASMLSKRMADAVAPLEDLMRAIYEDRGVTNTISNYVPKEGDELVDDSRRVWRVNRIISDKIVVLDCESDPTRIYVEVGTLNQYFIGKFGAAAQ